MRFLRKACVSFLVILLCVSSLYITASAGSIAYGAATVGATSLNIRSGPDTTYAIVTTAPHNEKLVILEKTSADWYHVVYNGTVGYVAALYLTDVVTAENFTATGTLSANDVLIRSGPSTTASQLGTVSSGTTVKIVGINSGWYKVVYKDISGYIRSDFITLTAASSSASSGTSGNQQPAPSPSAAPSPSQTPSPAPSGGTASKSGEQISSERQQLVQYAMQYVGGSYVYGGQSPSVGFDCSGLVYYVFHHFNYDVTRTASSQYAHDGTSVSKNDLLPGDLVFFSSNGGYSVTHVGIYIGNHQFVHASNPKNGILVSSLDSDYYTSGWYGAKRVLP